MSVLPLWNNDAVIVTVLLTVVLALVCVAASTVRRSAALRNCILLPTLLLALAAPVAPATARALGISFEIPVLHAVTVAPDDRAPSARDTTAAAECDSDLPVAASGADPDGSAADPGVRSPVEAELPATGAEPVSTGRVAVWALRLWMIGALVGLVGVVVSLARLRRLRRSVSGLSPLATGDLGLAIEAARSAVGLRRTPRLGTTTRIRTPVAFGWGRRGWVLLPHGAVERMSREQLTHVLTHEFAHLAHADPVIRIAQRVCLSMWWWHPLVHLLNRQLSHTREELCDNAVLSISDPVDYGTTLLSVGRAASDARSPALAVGLLPSHETLEQRIRSLLDPRRITMSRSRPSILLGAVLAMTATSVLASATRLTDSVHPASEESWAPPHAVAGSTTTRTFTRTFTLTVPDPTRPGHLDVDIKRGDILVSAHDGEHVVIHLTLPDHAPDASGAADGVQVVRATPTDFDIRQSGNTIEVNADAYEQTTHLEILVPRRTNLTLDSYRGGALRVDGVEGFVRARSQDNDIILRDIRGSADVDGYNGSFVADFTEVTGDLSFETYNGSVELTLPSDVKATTRVRTSRGVMRTDFELEERPDTVRRSERRDGVRSIRFDDAVVSDLNGGGFECAIETTNGDILLRRGAPSSNG